MIAEYQRVTAHGAEPETVCVLEYGDDFAVAVVIESTGDIVGEIEYFSDAESAIAYARSVT